MVMEDMLPLTPTHFKNTIHILNAFVIGLFKTEIELCLLEMNILTK